MTKEQILEWFTAGWRDLPVPEESGHPEFAWELGVEYRLNSNAAGLYCKGTIDAAFQEVYEIHFEDLVLYGE